MQPGQPVEFTVSASSHENTRNRGGRPPKYMARQASNLLPFETALPVLLLCARTFSDPLYDGPVLTSPGDHINKATDDFRATADFEQPPEHIIMHIARICCA